MSDESRNASTFGHSMSFQSAVAVVADVVVESAGLECFSFHDCSLDHLHFADSKVHSSNRDTLQEAILLILGPTFSAAFLLLPPFIQAQVFPGADGCR